MKYKIRVSRGNDFRLRICPKRIAPKETATFKDVTDLVAKISRMPGDEQIVQHEVTDEGDVIIFIPANTQKCSVYGVELSGKHNGNSWRWKDCEVFQITECNPCANMLTFETFDPETYYIYDDIQPSFDKDEEALVLCTHAHAWVEDGTLYLMESDLVSIYKDRKGNLIIQQNGNIKGNCPRPTR